ncbi:MAG TPA: TonB-dependent receptor, partial [Terracidiphilus sp.]|nr:TonB-dependent receptor [Terracidiphilus sp.]
MHRITRLILTAFVFFATAVISSQAQSVYGSIQGTVTDNTGAALPGTQVVAREVNTGVVQKVTSNQNGIYVISNMRPGTYEISAEKEGFGKWVNRSVSVRVGDQLSINVSMQVSSVTSSVEVTSEAPLVRTDDTIVGTVIEEVTIKQLPLSGRSAFDLALLTPGVQQATVSNGTSGDSQPRLSGGRPRTNEITLDGTSITDPRRGSSVISPNLDAIQEFAVITDGIPAQYGRLAGGIITATLKSGTNEFHGNLFEFYRGEGLGTARNYFATTVPQLVYNQFGGIIGGPISKKRKLFFFSDYQGTRNRAQSIYNITLPTAQEEQGDFSDILGGPVGTDPLGRTVYKNQIFDPSTTRTVNGSTVRDPFPGNAIPKTSWDPAAAKVVALYAQPTRSGISQNFYSLQRGGSNHDQADGRVDEQFSASDLAFVRFSYDRSRSIGTRPFPTAGGNLGEIDTFYDSAMAWTHTLSTSLVNDVRLGFLRGELNRLTPSTNVDALGIPNLAQEALPSIAPAGYTSIGDSPRFDPTQAEYQVTDNVSWVRGKNIIGFGMDFRRFSINDLQLTGTSFNFNTLQTSNGTNSNTGNSFASLLLGLSSQYSADPNTGRFYERSNYFAGYLQDEYKASTRLTVNAGLRYDVEQNPNEVDYNGSNFDFISGSVLTMRQLGTNRIQHTQWKNFGPRVGFDWNP